MNVVIIVLIIIMVLALIMIVYKSKQEGYFGGENDLSIVFSAIFDAPCTNAQKRIGEQILRKYYESKRADVTEISRNITRIAGELADPSRLLTKVLPDIMPIAAKSKGVLTKIITIVKSDSKLDAIKESISEDIATLVNILEVFFGKTMDDISSEQIKMIRLMYADNILSELKQNGIGSKFLDEYNVLLKSIEEHVTPSKLDAKTVVAEIMKLTTKEGFKSSMKTIFKAEFKQILMKCESLLKMTSIIFDNIISNNM